MIYKTVLKALLTVLIISFTHLAWALTPDDLRADAPPCKQTKAKRPKLAADKELPYIQVYRFDFNGGGWCDYTLGVPYPFNSQMNSYFLDELILLGGKQSWRRALNGKPWFKVKKLLLPPDVWPLDRVDLTGIHLVYPKSSGAPYVLGFWASGTEDPTKSYPKPPYCTQFSTVYRWDETFGAFKKADDTTRDVVLKYFYTAIAKPCSAAE